MKTARNTESTTDAKSDQSRRVTGEDVAKAAGVARSTVYLSLQGDERIKESTRERVRLAAQRLGFRPKASARALRGGRTHTIGVIFTHERSIQRRLIARYAPALERISNLLSERDYNLSLAGGISPSERPRKLPRLFHEVAMDGAIVVYTLNNPLLNELRALGVPFVVIDGPAPEGIFTVHVDECRAAELAVEHLVELGHRRIGSLVVTREAPSSAHRMWQYPRGFARAMAAAGQVPNAGWDSPAPALERLQQLWRQPEPPSALVVYDEFDACQVISWLRERNLGVPNDISVVALLDKGNADTVDTFGMPTITCSGCLQETMAERGITQLLHMIESNGTDVPKPELLEPTIVERESSGPARR